MKILMGSLGDSQIEFLCFFFLMNPGSESFFFWLCWIFIAAQASLSFWWAVRLLFSCRLLIAVAFIFLFLFNKVFLCVCNKVLLKYKGDRESFWHSYQKGIIKFYFSKSTVGGTCSCIFTSSWDISTLGVSDVNHLSSVFWNQFNKSFTKEFLKGCPGQGTTNLQTLRDNSWSYKFRVGNFFTESVMLLCQTRLVLSLSWTLPLDHFFLAPDLFTGSLSFLVDFLASFFFLSSLGGTAKPGEQLQQLPPHYDAGQKGCGGFSHCRARALGTWAQ